ncbi:hypothetical protein OSB04_un000381 [Centaurea solstitialis]|uniref:Uncharacterized protein n=1 Tax=Centaurea solstitialis TaxID=347529 RepID=A0AA38SI77_9ASTR|nr:hypothetical protein OSB04_un000381 [Centaurea solstitialis]
MSKEIISIGSETRPPVLVVGEYQQWKRRMINFLDLLDDKLMVSITEGPLRPTVTVAEVARTEVTPYLPAYEVEKSYDMFFHEQRARAAIDKRALTLLTMALPNDMFARVDSCKDVRSMWLGIEQQMQGGDKALESQKENAMNAYESFCAHEGETLTDTYNRLNICVNNLRRLGLEKNKYEVNVKFLKRLNKLWQSVTISIQVSQNLGQLGLHDLYSMMLPHEETLFGKTEKKIDPPTLALMSNIGSSSHENYTVEEPVVLDDGLTEEEMFQLENFFVLMAKFRGNPQRFNRFRQGPQFVGGQSNQGGYQSRENFQRNDQGRSNNYQQRDSSGYNHQGSYQDRRQVQVISFEEHKEKWNDLEQDRAQKGQNMFGADASAQQNRGQMRILKVSLAAQIAQFFAQVKGWSFSREFEGEKAAIPGEERGEAEGETTTHRLSTHWCMPRRRLTADLVPFGPEIERTARKLRKQAKLHKSQRMGDANPPERVPMRNLATPNLRAVQRGAPGPNIPNNNFEIKHGTIQLVQANQF